MPSGLRPLIAATILATAVLPARAQRGAPAAPPVNPVRQKVELLRRAAEMRGREQAPPVALESAYRVRRDGTTEPVRCQLFDIGAALPGHLELRSIQLPAESCLRILGITLIGISGRDAVQVDLSRYVSTDAIAVPGVDTDGDMDGNGHALPADLFVDPDAPSTATTFRAAGVAYLRPSIDKGAANAIAARGQVLRLPSGTYSHIHVLAASVGGETRSKLIFQFRTSGQLASQKAEQDFYLPDCAIPVVQVADVETSPLCALLQLVDLMGGARTVPLPGMRVQLGLGARAETTSPASASAGMSWAGEKTETTFTCIADVRALLPDTDYEAMRVVLRVGIDDRGVLYCDGHKVVEFRGTDGRYVLLERKPPAAPFAIGISGFNDTGEGRLLRAEIKAEFPSYGDYTGLIEDLIAAEDRCSTQPEAVAAIRRAREQVFAAVPVDAIIKRDHAHISAAARRLRAELRAVLAPTKTHTLGSNVQTTRRRTPTPEPEEE